MSFKFMCYWLSVQQFSGIWEHEEKKVSSLTFKNDIRQTKSFEIPSS